MINAGCSSYDHTHIAIFDPIRAQSSRSGVVDKPLTDPQIRVCLIENYLSQFSTKTYAMGTQNNRLGETVLLSSPNTCIN